MDKSADAFRTISEAAEELHLPQHVLRFWETRFAQIKPLKRAGGRRYYRPRDIEILRAIKHLLYAEGYTIKGVQRLLKEQGVEAATSGRDSASEDGADFPPSASESSRFHNLPHWQAGSAGHDLAEPDGMDPFANFHFADGQKEPAGNPVAGARPALGLGAADIARLEAALAELAQCEQILLAACRRQA